MDFQQLLIYANDQNYNDWYHKEKIDIKQKPYFEQTCCDTLHDHKKPVQKNLH